MTNSRVFGINPAGRDFVVGDVHGCYRTLERALSELAFDPSRDRLFGVGDLVNRGPHSEDAVQWLEERFHAVSLGNHDLEIRNWFGRKLRGVRVGGFDWLPKVNRDDYQRWYSALARMPLALTIATPCGPVGVIHAQVPDPVWDRAIELLSTGEAKFVDIAVLGYEGEEKAPVRTSRAQGVRALVHGHWPVREVQNASNRWNIDTGAGHDALNRLSLLEVNAAQLRPWTFEVDEGGAVRPSASRPRRRG